jgi:hypothetical protein
VPARGPEQRASKPLAILHQTRSDATSAKLASTTGGEKARRVFRRKNPQRPTDLCKSPTFEAVAYERIKTEHAGAKNGGGAWMTRANAKQTSKRNRRENEKQIRRSILTDRPPGSA